MIRSERQYLIEYRLEVLNGLISSFQRLSSSIFSYHLSLSLMPSPFNRFGELNIPNRYINTYWSNIKLSPGLQYPVYYVCVCEQERMRWCEWFFVILLVVVLDKNQEKTCTQVTGFGVQYTQMTLRKRTTTKCDHKRLTITKNMINRAREKDWIQYIYFLGWVFFCGWSLILHPFLTHNDI